MGFMRAALFAAGVQAVAFPQPRATSTPELPDNGISPVPTPGPELRRLMRRDDDDITVYYAEDNTCGFVSGVRSNAYTCNNVNANCVIITVSTHGYIGCCGTTCAVRQTCIDARSYSSSLCNDACRSDSLTLKCTARTAPYCNSVTINAANSLSIYGFYCDATATSTYEAILTTYIGETDGRSFSPYVLDSTVFDSTGTGGTATFGDAGAATDIRTTIGPPSTTVGGVISTTTSTPSPTSSGSKTNVGAIVGGTVGGVLGLALIGLVAFFLVRRKRKNAAAQTPPAVPPVYGAPGVPPAGVSPAGVYGQPSDQKDGIYAGGPPTYIPPTQPYYPGQPQQPQQPQPPYDRVESPTTVDYSRLSSVSGVGSTSPYTGPISPQTTGQGQAGAGGQPQVPATIHEAGSNVVGAADANPNHRGEMHELA